MSEKQEKVYKGKEYAQVDIKDKKTITELSKEKIDRVVTNSMRFLSSVNDDHLDDWSYIPESVQPYINNFVREGKKTMDWLNGNINKYDKGGDEYIGMQKEMENIAKTFINARKQIDKYKQGIKDFKSVIGNMNPGTRDSNYYINSAVFGNQWDGLEIDKEGNFNFGLSEPMGAGRPSRVNKFRLDDMLDVTSGQSPIITEPYGSKAYVWKLAEKIKADKDSGRPFDGTWTYKRVLNNFKEGGPHNTIGMAFTDMTGDNSSKSFAEMWEDGLKDPLFYLHPETGEPLPENSGWMKNKNNAEVLSQLLAKYVTDVMKDVYGVVDEDTGLVKKSQSDLAQELIKKYKHPGHEKH
tara:strand:+ start:1215 stop:2270 length:1056 start_codon:yes stop_codon:yes gene_type:complete